MENSLSRGIGGTNLVYTQYINLKYSRSGRLWQNRFFRPLYSKLLKKENPDEAILIKQATSTGRPLGSKNFVQRLEKKLDRPLVAKRRGRPPMRKQ